MRWFVTDMLAGACSILLRRPNGADTINFCATGTDKWARSRAHRRNPKSKPLRESGIDELIRRAESGGPDFFSTQVVIQRGAVGFGDFDLHLFKALPTR